MFLKLILTDGINSQRGTGRIAGFAQTSLVYGDDSELVLGALAQLRGFDGPVDDRTAVHLGPGQLSGLTLLHHVAQDSCLAVIGWGLPAYCHGVLSDVGDDRWFTRSRNIYKKMYSHRCVPLGFEFSLGHQKEEN